MLNSAICILAIFIMTTMGTYDYDEYGGWMAIRGEKTGYFHAEQIDGVWWLIDPADNGFLYNLTSTFLCSKYAMNIMHEQNSGRIINVSSMAGHRGAQYGHVHYVATKSGQLGFTKTLARTAAPYGITVNAVAPGIIKTELLHQTHDIERLQTLTNSVPLGLGNVEDVGNTVVFLASDEARYITGATIDINGGMYLR